jgi:hypothetical protein
MYIYNQLYARCTYVYIRSDIPGVWTIVECDAVYIDGLHTYEGVKNDIIHWLPQTKKVICGHDYYEDEEFLKIHPHVAGVKVAVDEMLGKPDKIYSDGSWLKWIK